MTIGLWWCPFHSDAIRLRVGRCIVWLYISCWNNYSNMSEMLNATDDIKKDGLSLSTGKLVPNKENGLFSYCWFTSPQKCQNQHSWIMHTLVSSSKKILTHTHTHTHTHTPGALSHLANLCLEDRRQSCHQCFLQLGPLGYSALGADRWTRPEFMGNVGKSGSSRQKFPVGSVGSTNCVLGDLHRFFIHLNTRWFTYMVSK